METTPQPPKMRLKPIPHTRVSASIAASHTAGTNHHGTADFNTSLHTAADLSAALPHPPHITHHATTPSPLHDPFAFSTWLPLIARSQHLPPASTHTLPLPTPLIPDLLTAHARWLRTGALPPALLHALATAWPALAGALAGPPYFLRLDACSPKDAALSRGPVAGATQALAALASSMRAAGALARWWEAWDGEDDAARMHVVLAPWNGGMDAAREFRVFVPPGRGLRVAAVSQYRWCGPLGVAGAGVAEVVVEGAERVVGEVVGFAREVGATLLAELEGRGCVVDVALMGEDGAWEVQLVELNPFGALTGCGSCLFHWIRDARVLYGLEGEEVEMRVVVKDD